MFPQPISDDPQTLSATECVPFRRFSFTGLISGADSHPKVKCADGFSLCLISLIVVREQRGVGAEGRGVAQREETNGGMQRGLQAAAAAAAAGGVDESRGGCRQRGFQSAARRSVWPSAVCPPRGGRHLRHKSSLKENKGPPPGPSCPRPPPPRPARPCR